MSNPRAPPPCFFISAFFPPTTAGFEVEVEETLSFAEAKVEGEYDRGSFRVLENNGGVDPIDAGCPPVGKCVGAMTRVSGRHACYGYTNTKVTNKNKRAIPR